MITDDNKKLAQWAMEYALKNGCQAAKLVLYTNSNSSFELRDGKMDRLQQSTENGLGLNLYVDGRFGSFSTNRLDKKELETLITNGIESTRYLAVDESRMLADPARYYKGGKPDLQLFDKKLYEVNPDDKVAIARAAAEEVLGKDERIISVDSSYSATDLKASRRVPGSLSQPVYPLRERAKLALRITGTTRLCSMIN